MSDSAASRLLPVFIGVFLTIVLLVGLGYLASMRRNATEQAAPALRILAPQSAATVDSPLVIRFTSQQPIELKQTGWGTGRLHLHARVNGLEHMPAAADITRADSVYSWTIGAVARGPFSLALGWADQAHRELRGSATPLIHGQIR